MYFVLVKRAKLLRDGSKGAIKSHSIVIVNVETIVFSDRARTRETRERMIKRIKMVKFILLKIELGYEKMKLRLTS
jgi:hypothetical protein